MKTLITIFSLFALSCSAQVKLKLQAGTYTPPYVPPTPIPGNTGAFTFTLGSQLKTSAGVFRNDSILVKTLWNDETITSGSYTRYWDGTDDYGNVIPSPDANYKVKVLSNNVKYEWQGTIGNSSDSMTGVKKHKGLYNCMTSLVFVGSYGYFSTGYGEGYQSVGKFNVATPNQRINIYDLTEKTADINYSCTDGSKIYWGAFDAFSINNSFVYATDVSTDLDATFSTGVPISVTYSRTYNSVISKLNQANSLISGIAVQQTGIYLFVARKDLNQLQVLNKTTGALVSTLTFTAPTGLCVDNGDNLWMVSNNTVTKYSVSGGALTSLLTLPGTVAPLTVNYGNGLIAVSDGNTSQQVKFYNTSGTAQSTLGTLGGYFSDATVSNSKFYFSDSSGNKETFIAWQSDGSFWVNDPGNFRVQHFNSSNVFVNRVMSLGSTYYTQVDANNATRLFAGFLEYSIDYSVQTLTGSTGWALSKNWGAKIPTAYDYFGRIRSQTTLSNGRTYGMIRIGDYYEIVELVTGGQTRFTGVLISLSKILCNDGSLQDYTESGSTATLRRYPLSGFSSNNPTWSSTGEVLAILPYGNNPVTYPNSQAFSGHRVAFFNYNSYQSNSGPVYTTGYHLSASTRGSSSTLFNTEKSTHRNYAGAYPKPGWFEVGNRVNNYAGSTVNILDRNIITGYHGEFWKNGQTNQYNHYYDNGLAIGQFGTNSDIVGIRSVAAFGMAGNALTPTVIGGADSIYLYHGDESYHAAIHRWKVSGLSTISEQVVSVNFPSAYVAPSLNYTDLMGGVPFNSGLTNDTNGWTRMPTADNSNWIIKTSYLTYNQYDKDIWANFSESAVPGSFTPTTNILARDLGTNNVTTNWKITGQLSWGTHATYNDNQAYQYLEVLDGGSKVLTTLYPSAAYNTGLTIKGNTTNILTTTFAERDAILRNLKDFEISIVSGVVTFKFNGSTATTTISDGTGNWRTPKTLRARFYSDGGWGTNYGAEISLSNLKLYKDY